MRLVHWRLNATLLIADLAQLGHLSSHLRLVQAALPLMLADHLPGELARRIIESIGSILCCLSYVRVN